jgi:4-hydroxybenzoate polyprenyltransferase
LVIDLDDTLVRTDTLLEQILSIAFKTPWRLPAVLLALLGGRASFKRAVAGAAVLDVASLPYNEAVLAYIADRKAAGSPVHLVTAADQGVAQAVADHLGVFDSARGSDGRENLKGARKGSALAERFDGPFDYVGDCQADLHIWRKAREVHVVNPSSGLRRRLEQEKLTVHAEYARPKLGAGAWLKALRLHQWVKNGVMLVPLILSQQFLDPAVAVRTLIGLLLFSLVASATYLVNDLSDLAADRLHPHKRHRALAAGDIHIRVAAPVALLLMMFGLIASFVLHPGFGWITSAYVVTTLLYSFSLKSQPLIDVLTIGGLFTIRVIAGMFLADAPISLWLSTFTFVLFTSLALAKRNGELARAQSEGRTVVGRGYVAGDTLLTTSLGIATGVTAVVVMVLYLQLEAPMLNVYERIEPLFLIPIVLAAWILRIWLRAHRGELQDDPVVFALKDKVSWGHAAAVGALWLSSTL